MGLFQNAFFFAGVMYAVFYENKLILYFLAFVGAYAIMYALTPSGNFNSLRRRIMFSTWSKPAEGNIHVKQEMDCTNILKYFEKFEKADRPSITHIVTKALAQSLTKSRDTLNGKIIFDKFVPFEKIAVTVLVEIDGGKDLAALTIEDVDKMSIKDLQQYIRAKGRRLKEKKDEEHKKRTDSIKFLPPFLLRIILQVVQWLAFNFGLNIKALSVKKDTFGAGCVTSLGMLGIRDAIVPFTPFMNCPVIVAVGEIVEKPIVKNKEIVIAPMVYINFTIDHRFIDGAKGTQLKGDFIDVFENPEKY